MTFCGGKMLLECLLVHLVVEAPSFPSLQLMVALSKMKSFS